MGNLCVSTVLVPTALFWILHRFCSLVICSFTDIDEWGVYVHGNLHYEVISQGNKLLDR